MAELSFTLSYNKRDDTVTVKRGRSVEHFDASMKTEYELVEAIRWSLISKDISVSWAKVHDLLIEEKRSVGAA
jgi:hypothetical protein